ncbi:MAG TPA: alpha/beta hydrolase, partial [Marmoricola sp.]|nr:alpha/beta hydrolase [Marmoricola sp.]
IAPGAVVEVIGNCGHFPHKDHPERFVKTLNDFIRHTRPASYDRDRWRDLLRNGPEEPVTRQLAGLSAI